MRIRFGNKIYLCTIAKHTEGSTLLLLTTHYGVYIVDMVHSNTAKVIYNMLLTDGYCDLTGYNYE